MKYKKFFFASALAVMLVACTVNDDNPVDGVPAPTEAEIEQTYDDIQWVRDRLLSVDEETGEVKRKYGEALDESHPTILSIGVADEAEARKLFKLFLANENKILDLADGSMTAELTDSLGESQGWISYHVETEQPDGVVASIEMPEGLSDLCTQIRFVSSELWPSDAVSEYDKYEIADLVFEETNSRTGNHDLFYCVRKKEKGKPLLAVCIADWAIYTYDGKSITTLAKEDEVREAFDELFNNRVKLCLPEDSPLYDRFPMYKISIDQFSDKFDGTYNTDNSYLYYIT